jgi:hypothetical protein
MLGELPRKRGRHRNIASAGDTWEVAGAQERLAHKLRQTLGDLTGQIDEVDRARLVAQEPFRSSVSRVVIVPPLPNG